MRATRNASRLRILAACLKQITFASWQDNWSGSLKYGAVSETCVEGESPLQQAEIASLEPALVNPPSHGRYAAKDGAIEATEATRILVEKACEKGAVLQTETTVTSLCMTDGKVTGVLTSQGQLDADCVVLACGTGISALTAQTGTPVPVLSSPAILLRFTAPRCAVKTIISGDDVEVRHARNGDVVAAEDYPASGNVRETAMAAQTAVRSRLKGAESSSLIHYSTGERPVLQDGYPILGFIDESKSLYVASMHPAVTCAATIGRLVCEELSDGKYDAIPQHYRPSRFTTKP